MTSCCHLAHVSLVCIATTSGPADGATGGDDTPVLYRNVRGIPNEVAIGRLNRIGL